MFGFKRRDVSRLDVRFCDGRGEVTTAAQRAAERRERDWTRAAGSTLAR
jgi:hypothetical protein